MIYPSLLLVTALVVSVLMLVVVFPKFSEIYESFNTNLPRYTLALINLSAFLKHHICSILSILIFGPIIFRYFYKTKLTFKKLIDQHIFKIPLFGRFYYHIILLKIIYVFSLTYTSGLSIKEIFALLKNATNNELYKLKIASTYQEIIKGSPLSQAISKTNLFPPNETSIIEAGEESGTLDAQLTMLYNSFSQKINNFADNLSTLLEPVMLVFLGTIIGLILVGMYLPLFRLGNIV